MKVKHKLLLDYQYVSEDKKIFLIKSGTIIEEYIYTLKGELLEMDKEIVDANPQIFQIIDWKNELLSHLKFHKIPQPAQVSKKLIPFIEDIITSVTYEPVEVVGDDKLRELQDFEGSLNRLKNRLDDRDLDINLRESFLTKREADFQRRIEHNNYKEDQLEKSLEEISSKKDELNTREQILNDKERNIENMVLKSSVEVEDKLKEVQSKIDNDFKSLSIKEKELNSRLEKLNEWEKNLNEKECNLNEKEEHFKIEFDKVNSHKDEVYRIMSEIEQWEKLHWKFKNFKRPPSTLD